MKNKELLLDQISSVTNPSGEVYIIDIFYPERVWARLKSKTSKQAIFDYLSVQAWQELFSKHNFSLSAYHNISQSVANHVQIKISEAQFEKKVLDPIFTRHPDQKKLKKHMLHALVEYEKLGRLFKRNMLEYGVLKFKRGV